MQLEALLCLALFLNPNHKSQGLIVVLKFCLVIRHAIQGRHGKFIGRQGRHSGGATISQNPAKDQALAELPPWRPCI